MPRLYLFTRYPTPGRTKTRLIPALGASGAARLHRRLVRQTLETLADFQRQTNVDCRIRYDGAGAAAMIGWLGLGWCCEPQGEGDLGQRMAAAVAADESSGARVIIGSDCPGITPAHLDAAFRSLEHHDLVLGPAADGGYWLIGLRHPCPELFVGVNWGTERVLSQTLAIARAQGLRTHLLETLTDIDQPEDLPHWNPSPLLTVVLPVLNEAGHLPRTLASIGTGVEVIVVDGSSTDESRAIALAAGATVIPSAPGRARQMNAGAAAASGETLLFLHGDTVLPRSWRSEVTQALADPQVAATAFRLRVDAPQRRYRGLEATVTARSRWLGLPYGDQALALGRETFEKLGGFPEQPIMEDYSLVRQLQRCGRIHLLASAVTTSPRRWQRLGLLRTTLINQLIVLGWHTGVAPERLARFYHQARQSWRKR